MVSGCGKAVTTTPEPGQNISPTITSSPQPSVKKPIYGGILKYTRNVPPGDPIGNIPEMGPSGFDMVNLTIFESLFRLDSKGKLIPILGTQVKVSDDRTFIEVNLRQGVKFHDGTDFNADTVKWNFDRWIKARGVAQLKSMEIIDPYKIRINLSYFSNTVYSALTGQAFFQTSPQYVEKVGEESARWNPVGTGPFKFVKYERDVKLVAEKFIDYWDKGKPYLDGIEVVILPDHMTRQMAYRSGDLHITFMDGKQAADLRDLGFSYVELPVALPVHALVPSSANPASPWSNKKVREAAWYAIDRKTLTDSLGYGLKVPLNQIADSGSLAFVPEIETLRPYDPNKAKQLLADAGFANGFKTKFIIAPRWVDRDLQVAMQSQFKRVGIEAELEFPEEGKYGTYRWNKSGWGEGIIFQEYANWPLYTSHISFYWNYQPAQFFDLQWPEGLHKLATESLQTTEIKKELVQQFNRMLFDDATLIPLYELKKIAFVQKNVHNSGILTSGFKDDWTPAETWIEAKTK